MPPPSIGQVAELQPQELPETGNIMIIEEITVFNVAGYLMMQMACNLMLPHEDNVLNKFRNWKERHIRVRKPYQLPG